MKKNRFLTRMTALLLVLVCMLGLLPTAALAADAPSSIKLEDCTHNGVHYESPSLGTCWLHQMTFDYNQKSTICFCAEHGKGMGWSLEGQTWGNPKPITDPTVQTMMAYYYAHTTGVFTDQAHALGVDEVWGSDYSWTMNAWVQAIIWRYQAGLLTDPATACAEELVCVYNNLHHGNYSGVDDLLDGMSFRDRAQYILDLGKQGVWGDCTVHKYAYTGSSTSSHQAKDVQAIMIGELNVIREKYDLTVKKVDATNPNKGLPGARFIVRSENGTYEKEVVTGSDGTYTLSGLDASTYSVVELAAPEGYEIDNAGPQYVALPNGGSKGRILRTGESQRKDGRYAYKYTDSTGKPQFVYAWKLVATDKTPTGKRDDISLREKEAEINRDIADGIDAVGKKMTVCQLYAKQNSQRADVSSG